MNNKPIKIDVIDGIYDIEPLIQPAMSRFELTFLSLLILLVISILFYYTWKLFYSSKGIAKRKIKRLHKDFSQGKISDHDVVYQASSILLDGLKLNYINKDTLLPDKLIIYKSEWKTFNKNLSYLRYSKHDNSSLETSALINDCAFWLKKWP